MDRPPLSESTPWGNFRNGLQTYVEIARDERQHSLKGFTAFRSVDEQLNTLLSESAAEQFKIADRRDQPNRQLLDRFAAGASLPYWLVLGRRGNHFGRCNAASGK